MIELIKILLKQELKAVSTLIETYEIEITSLDK